MFPVTKIQHFCTKDGFGIRTTVFLKGCPLKCKWCHNPETQTPSPEFFFSEKLCVSCGLCEKICPQGSHVFVDGNHLFRRENCIKCMECVKVCPTGALELCAKNLSAEEIFDEVAKDIPFYGKEGGVTFSGGEPTVYHGELIPLMNRFRENGINTALETCGYFPSEILPELVKATDLFLWDIKDTDSSRHKENTGVSTEKIIENLRLGDKMGAKTLLRCIILKGVNLDETHLKNLASLYVSLENCMGIELIPYHTYGVSKRKQLGLPADPHKEWIPAPEEIRQAENFLSRYAKIIHN